MLHNLKDPYILRMHQDNSIQITKVSTLKIKVHILQSSSRTIQVTIVTILYISVQCLAGVSLQKELKISLLLLQKKKKKFIFFYSNCKIVSLIGK